MPRNIIIGQNVSPALIQRARELRQHMTTAEKALWQALRANRLNGWHFRRQQIIGDFIVDFYCHAAGLAIELDGEIHQSQQERDRIRTELIRDYGIEVIRFDNEMVLNQLPQALEEIGRCCRELAEQGSG